MRAAAAVAEILKREGTEFLIGYPVNSVIEAAAEANLRPIIPRQERTGIHMADALSRLSSGDRIGVFCMQLGPGAENSFGGIAQAYADSVPIVLLPEGYERSVAGIPPNFSASLNYRAITKWVEHVSLASLVPDALRRAFTQVRNGRPRPVAVEFPCDVLAEEVAEPLQYTPAPRTRSAPDPSAVSEAARLLVGARRPVIYAGQGVHYARAWGELRELAELLGAPVTTSLQGKSAFPEHHPLALGSGGRAIPKPVQHFLQEADVIFGIGWSFTSTPYGVAIPPGKTVVQATLDPADLNQSVPVRHALVGDASLTLEALVVEVRERLRGSSPGRLAEVAGEIQAVREEWLGAWMPKLTSDEVPLNPYRVIWDLMHTVDRETTIVTHDAGSPRDQLSPFWQATAPLTYIGWGKTTQLGYGLGLAMGAKLAEPEKLCLNVMGDAAMGFTGMDFETAVREHIPILTIVLNNLSMAIELPVMEAATEKFRSTDISGNYADLARVLGGYGERVRLPEEIVPALRRSIEKTKEGTPALLEFMTSKEIAYSLPESL